MPEAVGAAQQGDVSQEEATRDGQDRDEEHALICEEQAEFVTGVVEEYGMDWKGRRYCWLGRICAFRVSEQTVLYVGPHWYFTLVMLGVIIGVGCMYTFALALELNIFHFLAGCVATVWSTVSFLQCALSNPGVLQKHPYRNGIKQSQSRVQFIPSGGQHECAVCAIVQPRGSLHCEFCHVCVAGWDHHCPWMSKCIGQNNLQEFYSFLCVSLTSLGYMIVVTFLHGYRP